ncbi:MAG: hypothetical protein ACRD3Q_18425 [Terriglobales bacterium]
MTLPGVPDFYQGNELWDFSLVDPDNRRPVDYEVRRRVLETMPRPGSARGELRCSDLRECARRLLTNPETGGIKMYLTQRVLSVRKNDGALFQPGRYLPLEVRGEKANHVCAFARELEGRVAIVAVPRLCAMLLGEQFRSPCEESLWTNTEVELPSVTAPCLHNAFTGECIAIRRDQDQPALQVGKMLRDFPVALLLSERLTS